MECSCNIGVEADEIPELFSHKIRKAKKKYSCVECHSTILPGQEYEAMTGKWFGKFETYRTCKDCVSVRKNFFKDGFIIGDLWDNFFEYLDDEVPESCIANLIPTARAKVCEAIEEVWEELDDDD